MTEPAAAPAAPVESGGFTPPVNQRETVAKYTPKEAEEPLTAEPSPATPEPKLESAKPTEAPPAIDGAKLASMLKSGDFEGALRLAGIDPAGTKIPAARWAEFRKHEKESKERIRQAEARTVQRDNEVRTLAAEVAKRFEPYEHARKAWESGDIESALKHAFGADLESLSEMAVKQKLGQDPEVVALKRWKADQERAAQERAAAEQKAQAEQTTAAQRREYCSALSAELKSGDATHAAAVETFPDFAERVMQIQLDAYNKSGEELSAAEAAGQLIEKLRPWLEKWSKVLGDGATPKLPSSVEAAIVPPITDRTGKLSAKDERKFVAKKARPGPAVPDTELDDDARRAAWKKRLVLAAREDGLIPA
jgi:hypothetical protein